MLCRQNSVQRLEPDQCIPVISAQETSSVICAWFCFLPTGESCWSFPVRISQLGALGICMEDPGEWPKLSLDVTEEEQPAEFQSPLTEGQETESHRCSISFVFPVTLRLQKGGDSISLCSCRCAADGALWSCCCLRSSPRLAWCEQQSSSRSWLLLLCHRSLWHHVFLCGCGGSELVCASQCGKRSSAYNCIEVASLFWYFQFSSKALAIWMYSYSHSGGKLRIKWAVCKCCKPV